MLEILVRTVQKDLRRRPDFAGFDAQVGINAAAKCFENSDTRSPNRAICTQTIIRHGAAPVALPRNHLDADNAPGAWWEGMLCCVRNKPVRAIAGRADWLDL